MPEDAPWENSKFSSVIKTGSNLERHKEGQRVFPVEKQLIWQLTGRNKKSSLRAGWAEMRGLARSPDLKLFWAQGCGKHTSDSSFPTASQASFLRVPRDLEVWGSQRSPLVSLAPLDPHSTPLGLSWRVRNLSPSAPRAELAFRTQQKGQDWHGHSFRPLKTLRPPYHRGSEVFWDQKFSARSSMCP